MCGIAGILRTWERGVAPPGMFESIPEGWLDVLDESIRHRGPDGCGRFRQRTTRPDGTTVEVALVHRRLSIIDHATGAQPMVLGDGADGAIISREGGPYEPARPHRCPKCGPGVLAVVFNGCIYNHRELRKELEGAGHEFFSDHSDTEVLLHGWREWGPRTLDRIEGMFALAIWDGADGRLLVGRDPFGEKPLHAMEVPDGGPAVIASCVSGLSQIAGDEGASPIDGGAITEWTRFGYHAEATPLSWVSQISSATLVQFEPRNGHAPLAGERRRLEPKRLARLKRGLPVPGPSRTTEDRIDQLIGEAVAVRLEADVDIGCLLSGGVDSSLVSHHATRVRPGAVTTICVRMPDPRYDESAYAQIVAEHLRSRHIVVDADPRPAEDLHWLVETLGLPFGDSSLLPTYWACRAAASEVGVLLSGDGGDELFLGYERYVSAKLLELPGMLAWFGQAIKPAAMALPRRDPKSRWDKLARFMLAGLAPGGQEYRELLSIFPRHEARRLLPDRGGSANLASGGESGPLDARDYDIEHHLPGDLLRKVDTASMISGVELRSPFLDSSLARAALALPVQRLMPLGRRKGLLRAIARRYLPPEIVDRPKMGFAIPIGEWFRSDYGGMRQLLYDHLGSADPFPGLAEAGVELNMDFVRRMLREHDAAGERSVNPWHGRDHSQRLYMLVVLSIWCRWVRGLAG